MWQSLIFQLDDQKKEKEKGAGNEREPASWRYEKKELERQVKEHKKKLDDMHGELTRQQFKWKTAGDDLAKVSYIYWTQAQQTL